MNNTNTNTNNNTFRRFRKGDKVVVKDWVQHWTQSELEAGANWGKVIDVHPNVSSVKIVCGDGWTRSFTPGQLTLVEEGDVLDEMSRFVQIGFREMAEDKGWTEERLRQWLKDSRKNGDLELVLNEWLQWQGVHGFTGAILSLVRTMQ